MKLYYAIRAASATGCHIALEEAGIPYEGILIDWAKTEDPDYQEVMRISPTGQLPVLVLDDGSVLTQNVSILTHIAELAPRMELFPRGGIARVRALEKLAFIATDIHWSLGVLFAKPIFSTTSEQAAAFSNFWEGRLHKFLSPLDRVLSDQPYVCGPTFTVVDAYAFVVLGWAKQNGFSLERYHSIRTFMQRMLERPAVQKTLAMEGTSVEIA